MRRLLIILLLTLLPIQSGWAAMCAYCPDDCVSESSTGATSDEVRNDAAGLDNDDECSRCHLGGVGIAASLAAARIFPPPNKLASWDRSAFLDSGQADRPERPNWTRAA